MAEIELQKKRPSIVPWIIGLVILVLLIWGLLQLVDREEEEVVADESAVPLTPAPAIATVEIIPVRVIVTTPADYAGQQVSGTAQVAEVVSDRGFWIEQEGQRLFVIIDEPVPETIDINAGQTVQLTGTVYTSLDQVQGQMEEQTRRVAGEQRLFLFARAADVKITERPTTTR